MIDCAQIRLELLRHHVRQSHLHHQEHHQDNFPPSASQRPQQQSTQPARTPRPPINFNECTGPIAAAFHNPTRVALFQLTNTSRPLQMSRFTVTPVTTNHQNVPVSKSHSKDSKSANRMLHVRVHNEERPETKTAELYSRSPSDSIDSGMPASPALLTTDDDDDILSPLPMHHQPATPPSTLNRFHFTATAHSAPTHQPQFRSRSASECLDMRQPIKFTSLPITNGNSSSNGSTASLSTNGAPLRSILKKPKVIPPGMGNTCIVATSLVSGLHHVPARYVLSRSVSECQDDTVSSNEELRLIDDDVVSMEDLTMAGGSPLSVCAEVIEEEVEMFGKLNDLADESTKPTAEQQCKKRVSFNEQVQARIYRSNSSIIATKNKQDRKLRNRMRRRAESESSGTPLTVEDLVHIPTIPLCKLSAEEKNDDVSHYDEKVVLENNDGLPKRRDSGFDPADSGVDLLLEDGKIDEGEEPMQVVVESSSKRVRRVVSSDSAIGDELIE